MTATPPPPRPPGAESAAVAELRGELAAMRETLSRLRDRHDDLADLLLKLVCGPSGEDERTEMIEGDLFIHSVQRALRDIAGSEWAALAQHSK